MVCATPSHTHFYRVGCLGFSALSCNILKGRIYVEITIYLLYFFLQTNYPIPKEEVEVYKALGEHEHIVTHYGGTFKGSQGHANIFMEKCGMFLITISV